MRFDRAHLLPMVLLVFAASACARPQAKTAPERPPLEIPAAPPRVIAPAAPEEDDVTSETAEPGSSARPARRSPARGGSRSEPAREESSKPETAPREEPAETRPPNPEPAPQLRTPQTANEAQAERRISETLARASSALKSVDYSALSADAKTQYDTAKRFIQQAEEALKGHNYVFASYVANKADALAKGLLGRE